jgi:hypothetical protein
MKVKVFTVTHSDQMEVAVNRWLLEHPSVEILHVRQSESMNNESWSMTLTIFHTEPGKATIGFETVTGGIE